MGIKQLAEVIESQNEELISMFRVPDNLFKSELDYLFDGDYARKNPQAREVSLTAINL